MMGKKKKQQPVMKIQKKINQRAREREELDREIFRITISSIMGLSVGSLVTYFLTTKKQ